MKTSAYGLLLAFACAGCTKTADLPAPTQQPPAFSTAALWAPRSTLHTIARGQHSSNQNAFRAVDASLLSFAVRFDSSAVYATQNPDNQLDINKLYGFSDNAAHHHQFSARFGWRWSDGALRLFAYVYNRGQRQEQQLGSVPIGAWQACSIGVAGNQYLFGLNGDTTALPRASATPTAAGYLLYPYFGGDETAPHDVQIEIREE